MLVTRLLVNCKMLITGQQMENWTNWWKLRLSHIYVSVILSIFAGNLAAPAITDVVVAAVCGDKEECSVAIYLTGFQQAITGLGAVVMMAVVGNLSDVYGRKRLLLIAMSMAIVPLAILAWDRTANFVYAYYAFKMLTTMVTDGAVIFLALAYLADNVHEEKRVSAFGLMFGVTSAGIVCGNFAARLLSTPHIFQLAATISILAVVYTIVLLKESRRQKHADLLEQPILEQEPGKNQAFDNESSKNINLIKKSIPSPRDIIFLIKRR